MSRVKGSILPPSYFQLMVAEHVSEGKTCKDISIDLGVEQRHIQTNINHLKKFYKARTVTHLIAIMLTKKHIPPINEKESVYNNQPG